MMELERFRILYPGAELSTDLEREAAQLALDLAGDPKLPTAPAARFNSFCFHLRKLIAFQLKQEREKISARVLKNLGVIE